MQIAERHASGVINMHGVMFVVGLMFGGKLEFETVLKLELVPEDGEHFLQIPASFDVNQAGDFFVLDVAAKVIFWWDKSGVYRGIVGRPGRGPGEFSFFGRGGPQGFVQAVGSELLVLDGGKRQLMVFSMDGTFKESRSILPTRSRIIAFFARPDGSFYLQIRKLVDEKLVSEIVLISATGEVLETLHSLDDDSFTVHGTSRENRSLTFRAYNPGLVSHYDRQTKTLVTGYSGTPEFQVLGATGRRDVIKLPTVQREITQADKDEFNQQPFLSRRRRIQIEFPEKKPYFDQILPVSGRGFLVFSISPLFREADGFLVSRTGSIQGRFTFICGENGSLLGSQGRILAIHLSEDDEFVLEEIVPKAP